MREVRSATGSRDFDSLPEGQKEVKKECCFVVLYGSEFNLRTLSIEGESSVSFPDCIMVRSSISGVWVQQVRVQFQSSSQTTCTSWWANFLCSRREFSLIPRLHYGMECNLRVQSHSQTACTAWYGGRDGHLCFNRVLSDSGMLSDSGVLSDSDVLSDSGVLSLAQRRIT